MKVPETMKGPAGDALRPGDLDDDVVGVTIIAIKQYKGDDDKPYFVAIYDEFPNKFHRLNKTSVGRLSEGFKSDDTDNWIGRVAVERVRTEDPRKQNESVLSVWVADSKDWPPQEKKVAAKRKR